MKTFSIISAMELNRGIGYENRLPWHLSADLKHFKEVTSGNTVIMGRKTWESIPEKFRPFSGRLNIVISRNELELPEDVLLAHSLNEALELAQTHSPARKAFVIGGATPYAEAIRHPNCEELLLTEIEESLACDAFFPEIPTHFRMTDQSEKIEEKGLVFRFANYRI